MKKVQLIAIEEAGKRLQILKNMGLWAEVLRRFNKGVVCYSSNCFQGMGTVYDIRETPENLNLNLKEADSIQQIVDDFERDYEAVVYFGILTPMEIGYLLSLLFVSKRGEDIWEQERDALGQGIATAYAVMLDGSNHGEVGSIGFECSIDGGLVRTW